MQARQLETLIIAGGMDRARQLLKKLSLRDRLPLLAELVPTARVEQKIFVFLRDHFMVEVTALSQCEWNVEKAEELYNKTKGLLRS